MASSVNLDTSERVDITCRRGDTFTLTLTLKNSAGTALTLATSGHEFFMQVRSSARSTGSARGVDPSRDLIIGSNTRGRKDESGKNFAFTTDDSGNLTITASSDIMQNVLPGSYVYDLQQILDGVSTTLIFGSFTVNDDISKIDTTR